MIIIWMVVLIISEWALVGQALGRRYSRAAVVVLKATHWLSTETVKLGSLVKMVLS